VSAGMRFLDYRNNEIRCGQEIDSAIKENYSFLKEPWTKSFSLDFLHKVLRVWGSQDVVSKTQNLKIRFNVNI